MIEDRFKLGKSVDGDGVCALYGRPAQSTQAES